jgi:hypothetical protein
MIYARKGHSEPSHNECQCKIDHSITLAGFQMVLNI